MRTSRTSRLRISQTVILLARILSARRDHRSPGLIIRRGSTEIESRYGALLLSTRQTRSQLCSSALRIRSLLLRSRPKQCRVTLLAAAPGLSIFQPNTLAAGHGCVPKAVTKRSAYTPLSRQRHWSLAFWIPRRSAPEWRSYGELVVFSFQISTATLGMLVLQYCTYTITCQKLSYFFNRRITSL